MPDSPPKRLRSAALASRGLGWLERFVLLVPGIAAIHLFVPPGATALQFALIALLVAAVAGWAARRQRGGAGSWFGRGRAPHQLQFASREGLLDVGNQLLQQAQADRRPLSVAVLELSDLPELHRLFGRRLAQQVLLRTGRKLRAVAGPKGLAARTSPTQFTLVLPGVDEDAVLLSLRTVFGEACCIEDDGNADEMVLLPQFEVATIEGSHDSIEPVYEALCGKLFFAQHRERTRTQPASEHCLQSRPAPASQPQELHALPPAAYVPTVPLPLPLR